MVEKSNMEEDRGIETQEKRRREKGEKGYKDWKKDSNLSYGRNGRNRNQIIVQYCIVAKEKVPEVAMEGFENED